MRATATLLVLLVLTPNAGALPEPTFQASWDAGFDADRAVGAPTAEAVGEPLLVPGKLGQAVRVGRELGQLNYASAGSFDLQRGTIEAWVRAVDWAPGDPNFCTIFGTKGFHLYKYQGASVLFYMITEGAETGSAAWADITDVDVQRWHHWAFTWEGGDMAIYCDGALQKRSTGSLPNTVDPIFHVGTGPTGFGASAQTEIDELRIYDRPLTDDEVRAAWLRLGIADTEAYAPPGLQVPQIEMAPKLDGDLGDASWAWAAGAAGLVDHATGRVAADQPTVMLLVVGETLYVGWRCPARGDVRPRLTITGTGLDGAITSIDLPEPTRARGSWVGEAAVPLGLVGEDGAQGLIVEGERDDTGRIAGMARADFVLTWSDGARSSWAYALPEAGAEGLGMIEIAMGRPAAMLLPPRWGDDAVRVGVELRGFDSWNDARLSARLRSLDGVTFNAAASVGSVLGAHRREVWLDVPLGDAEAVALEVELTSADRDGARWTALRQSLPATFRRSLACELTYHRFDELLDIALRPARDEVLRAAAGGTAIVTRVGEARPVVQMRLSPTPEGTIAGQADIARLTPGEYVVRGQLTGADGRVLASVEQPWTCEQDGWAWVRSLGQVEGVLPPWTPVEVQGSVARCWGREFDLGRGLPTRISSQGTELLSGPVMLHAQVGGEAVELAAASARVRADGPVGADVRSAGEAAGLGVELNGRMEYDGLVRYQVTLTPERPTRVRDLTLTIPLRTEHTTLLNFTPMDPAQEAVYEGEGSFAHGLPAGDGVAWSAGFVPFVWVGDEDLGISWMMEDDRAFDLRAGEPAVEIVRAGERTELRISFRRSARMLAEPLTIDFALQPTPARPLPDDWRTWRWISNKWAVPADTSLHGGQGWTNISVYWWTLFGDTIGWPVARDGNAVAQYAQYLRDGGALLVPYMQSGSVPTRVPEGRTYVEQWQTLPARTADQMTKCCPRSDFSEYVVWTCAHELDHLGAPGVYIDLAGVRACTNEAHGCGYRRGEELRPTMPIFAARRMYQRLRGLYLQRAIDPLIVTSSRWKWPHYFYTDSSCSGEQFYHPINTDKLPYHEIVPLDHWRAEFLSPQFGNVSVFLPAWRDAAVYARPDETRQMLALTLQHEVEVWPIWCNPGEVAATWTAKERFGMTRDAQFHPYWRPQTLVTTDSSDLLLGVYTRPGAAMAIVTSTAKEDREVALTVDRAQLGLPADALALDAVTGEPLPLDDGRIRLTVRAHDFRMVLLQSP